MRNKIENKIKQNAKKSFGKFINKNRELTNKSVDAKVIEDSINFYKKMVKLYSNPIKAMLKGYPKEDVERYKFYATGSPEAINQMIQNEELTTDLNRVLATKDLSNY